MSKTNNIKAVIIDYGSGNLHSAEKAFVKAVKDIGGGEIIVSNNPESLKSATHIVLPGVGAFGDCLEGLKAVDGMISSIEHEVLKNKKPFLGICVGMQMLAEWGDENNGHKGLGWLKGKVIKINNKTDNQEDLRIPHMGWNELTIEKRSPLTEGIESGDDVYFVHSYYFNTDEDNILATTNYGRKITAIVNKNNIYGVQFHPEKSQDNGLKLISNFLKL